MNVGSLVRIPEVPETLHFLQSILCCSDWVNVMVLPSSDTILEGDGETLPLYCWVGVEIQVPHLDPQAGRGLSLLQGGAESLGSSRGLH